MLLALYVRSLNFARQWNSPFSHHQNYKSFIFLSKFLIILSYMHIVFLSVPHLHTFAFKHHTILHPISLLWNFAYDSMDSRSVKYYFNSTYVNGIDVCYTLTAMQLENYEVLVLWQPIVSPDYILSLFQRDKLYTKTGASNIRPPCFSNFQWCRQWSFWLFDELPKG